MSTEKDLLILSNLRENARISLTDISKKTSIPISTIFDKLRVHEGNLIIKHTTLVDFNKLGYNTKAWIALKTVKGSRENLKHFLSEHKKVNNIYLVNNKYDFLIEVICSNIKELRDFFEELEEKFEITEKQEHIIIEDIKREKFLVKD